jgi:two-component system C4-dicarboxylate transport response regulator DctD
MSSGAFVQAGIEFATRPGKARILLVDEDASDLKFCRALLEGQGFEVTACASYEFGVRFLDVEPFDFVLVSQGSLAFEGRAVLDRAVELDRYRPVLVVTRCIDMGCYLEAMQMGAVDYLEKPVAPTELLRFVQAHVRHSKFRMQAGAS